MGVAVMPIQVTNRSNYSIARYFKLLSAENQEAIINIYPQNGQKFVFSEELSPGTYSITQVTSLLDTRGNVTSTVHKDEIDINTIYVEIYPGALSLIDAKMIIDQFNTEGNYFRTTWKIDILKDDEKKELIEEITQLQNSDKWEIVSN